VKFREYPSTADETSVDVDVNLEERSDNDATATTSTRLSLMRRGPISARKFSNNARGIYDTVALS